MGQSPIPSAPLIALHDYHVRMMKLRMLILAMAASSVALAQESYVLDDKTDKWVLTDSPTAGTPEAQLATAAKQLADGKDEEAMQLAAAWISGNERHPLIAEAHLIHGDALFAQKEYYQSLFDYELVARDHYGTKAAIAANEKELEIATMFSRGMKRKLWGMRISDATEEAEELFIRIQERLPRSPLAESAAIELADMYYRTKDMRLANEAYLIFVDPVIGFPNSEHIEKARTRLIYTRLAAFRGPAYDDSGLIDARKELVQLTYANKDLADTINSSALITRIDESLGQKLLSTAKWYLKVNKPIAAEYTVRRLVMEYKDTGATVEALEYLVPKLLPLLPPVVLSEVEEFYAAHQEALLGKTFTTIDIEKNQP
jgi:outer membrane protein assembly factor BamD (BamD/ComL family)